MQDHRKKLGTAPLGGLITSFAIPSIVAFLVATAYNITDQIFIGHIVGMLGNAATNVVFPLVTLTTALAQMMGVGTAANFNLRLGAKEDEEARRFAATGLVLMGMVGLLLFLTVLLFRQPLLYLCGATDSVFPFAASYLAITTFGLPFFLFSSSASVLIRADGSPRYAMGCTIAGALLNVVLDAWFMLGLGWGLEGAAAATVLGQLSSGLLALRYFRRFRSVPLRRTDVEKAFRLLLKRSPSGISYPLRIAALGSSNFLNLAIMAVVNLSRNQILRHYGALTEFGSDIPLAVSGVVAKLSQLLTSFTVGLAHGCQPIWSFNMGAGNLDRVRHTYHKAVRVGFVFSFAAFAIFQLFPRQVTAIFGSGSELYFRFAEQYLHIYLFTVFLWALFPMTINYFTSIGHVRQGIVLSLTRQAFLFLPMILIFPLFGGLDGALYAGPVSDGCAAVVCVLLMVRSFRHLQNEVRA